MFRKQLHSIKGHQPFKTLKPKKKLLPIIDQNEQYGQGNGNGSGISVIEKNRIEDQKKVYAEILRMNDLAIIDPMTDETTNIADEIEVPDLEIQPLPSADYSGAGSGFKKLSLNPAQKLYKNIIKSYGKK